MKYKNFVKNFCEELSALSGVPLQRMQFVKSEQGNFENGDRLNVVFPCTKNDENVRICSFEIRLMFNQLNLWDSIDQMVKAANELIEETMRASLYDCQMRLSPYEKIKDGLFIRIFNSADSMMKTNGAIHQKIGDICLTVNWKFTTKSGDSVVQSVTPEMAQSWKLTEKKILHDALKYSYQSDSPRIYFYDELIKKRNYSGEDFMNNTLELKKSDGILGVCLSNVSKNHGASAIFQPGVAERIAELLHTEKIYFVCSSSYEVSVYNGSLIDISSIHLIIEEHDKTNPQEGIALSKFVFEYDTRTQSFISHSPKPDEKSQVYRDFGEEETQDG